MARLLFFVALCSFVVGGVSSLWRALLNAHECFAFTALSPIMNPLMVLAVLLIAGPSWGIYALAAGAVLGSIGELSISRYALSNRGIALIPRWYGLDAPLRQVLAQTAPVVAGALLLGCSTLVDQAMAAMLGSGSVSALNYSNKLLSMILSIGVTSLSVATLPSFSRLSAKEDWSGMRHVLVTYTGLIVLVTVPLTLFIVMFSEPLVAMFYQGGAFTWRDTHLVSGVQTLLCLQLPFYALSILYVNAISSLKRNQILMFGTGISVVIECRAEHYIHEDVWFAWNRSIDQYGSLDYLLLLRRYVFSLSRSTRSGGGGVVWRCCCELGDLKPQTSAVIEIPWAASCANA